MSTRRKIAESYAKKFLGVKNVSMIDYLGSGSYAQAFKVSDNRVLKITRDIHDAVISSRLVGKNYDNVIKTFKVVAYECPYEERTLYIIETEFLNTLYVATENKYKIIREFICDVHSPNDYFKNKRKVKREFKDAFDETLEYRDWSQKEINLLESSMPHFENMMREVKDVKATRLDFHAGNFGFTNDGVIKLLDLGHESSKGNLKVETVQLAVS